jgi:hypothetical protein
MTEQESKLGSHWGWWLLSAIVIAPGLGLAWDGWVSDEGEIQNLLFVLIGVVALVVTNWPSKATLHLKDPRTGERVVVRPDRYLMTVPVSFLGWFMITAGVGLQLMA